MIFKVTLMSLNFERHKSSFRITKFSSLQENSVTNILVLKSICASLIQFAFEFLPVHIHVFSCWLPGTPTPKPFLKRFTCLWAILISCGIACRVIQAETGVTTSAQVIRSDQLINHKYSVNK